MVQVTEAQGGEKVHRINNGDLKFLGDEYRRDNNLEKPKKVGPAWGGRIAGGEPKGCRDWLSKKYYSSVMKLNEHEASFYGDRYNGLMASALTEIFRGIEQHATSRERIFTESIGILSLQTKSKMAYKLDKSALQTLFEGIRDERRLQANTANRIGNAFLSLLHFCADETSKPFSAASMTMQPRA